MYRRCSAEPAAWRAEPVAEPAAECAERAAERASEGAKLRASATNASALNAGSFTGSSPSTSVGRRDANGRTPPPSGGTDGLSSSASSDEHGSS